MGPEIPLEDGAVLERNRPYLIPLVESLNLPDEIRARANPKSSIGRIDIFTRLVVDRSPGFDDIPLGYQGPLYLEVVSRSFTVQVREGLSLNQVRFLYGDIEVLDKDLLRMHAQHPLIYHYQLENERPRPAEQLVLNNGLFLTVDLVGDTDKVVGYRAKENSKLLDLSAVGEYQLNDFWEPVESDRNNRVILEQEKFYLLVSLEGVSVPPEFAGEMTAYDPTSGELRTHYAGFFDPGFGRSADDGVFGSRAVLEVRAHDVPFALEHNQKIARIVFERMIAPPEKTYGPAIGSYYQNQTLKLSKFFREPISKTSRQTSYSGQPGQERLL